MLSQFSKPIEEQTKEQVLEGIRSQLERTAWFSWFNIAIFGFGALWAILMTFTGDFKSGIIFAIISSTSGLAMMERRQNRLLLKMFEPSPAPGNAGSAKTAS